MKPGLRSSLVVFLGLLAISRIGWSHEGTYGWKALTLLKVAGHWKIASELYTAYSLPE